jgi:hypothetical protein
MSNLQETLRTWGYFVDWQKVHCNLSSVTIELNILNSLIGSKDFESDFVALVSKYPEIKKVIPILLAVRDKNITVLENLDKGSFTLSTYNFNSIEINESIAHDLLNFMLQSKLSELFTDAGVKNFVDYVFGVEVGLDSNGRKNRGGTLMENVVEIFISKAATRNPALQYLKCATASHIKARFGVNVVVDKSNRIFDYAVFNNKTRRLYLIETNFYNGGGSKLKSVCGEFRSLNSQVKKQNFDFIWITDGEGWKTTEYPLREAYDELDYVINLRMVADGILDSIVSEGQ